MYHQITKNLPIYALVTIWLCLSNTEISNGLNLNQVLNPTGINPWGILPDYSYIRFTLLPPFIKIDHDEDETTTAQPKTTPAPEKTTQAPEKTTEHTPDTTEDHEEQKTTDPPKESETTTTEMDPNTSSSTDSAIKLDIGATVG